MKYFIIGLSNFLQCSLVCKSWNIPALQRLHSELWVASYITECLSIQADTFQLSITGVYLYERIDDIGMYNALELSKRFITVKNTGFSFIPYKG